MTINVSPYCLKIKAGLNYKKAHVNLNHVTHIVRKYSLWASQRESTKQTKKRMTLFIWRKLWRDKGAVNQLKHTHTVTLWWMKSVITPLIPLIPTSYFLFTVCMYLSCRFPASIVIFFCSFKMSAHSWFSYRSSNQVVINQLVGV